MIIWYLLILAALLLLSGFFSSVETAFTALTPGQLGLMEENQGKRGRLVRRLSERPDILLTTLLIGNNLANLGASAFATTLTIRLFGDVYVAAATGMLTLLVLVFCEVTPKQIAMASNENLCLRSAPLVLFLSWFFRPVIWAVTAVSSALTYLAVGKAKKKLTLEHLLHHVNAAEGAGVVESYEKDMVRNVFRINDTPVEAIMTHRTELFFLRENISVQDAVDSFLEAGYARAPVLKDETEHVLGVISVMELAGALRKSPQAPIKRFLSPPYLVPGTMKANELFFRLKKEPIQLAVVLDEYGGLDGIVTREDIMKEIFGELYDEREETGGEAISPEKGGSWLIQGDADFYDVSDILGLKLEHDSRTHTIGGYLLEKLEEIPKQGTVIDLPEGRYTILETRRQRITSLRFTYRDKPES